MKEKTKLILWTIAVTLILTALVVGFTQELTKVTDEKEKINLCNDTLKICFANETAKRSYEFWHDLKESGNNV